MDDGISSTQVKIFLFGKAAELAKIKEHRLFVPKNLMYAELLDKITNTFNLQSIRDKFILAVNEEFVTPDTELVLSESDVIAVIPPLSGGLSYFQYTIGIVTLNINAIVDNMGTIKNFLKLQKEELNLNDIINLVSSPDCGAISNFIGVTRNNFEGKKVVKLEYEAYEPMAIKEMVNICAKIRSQWNVERIAIYHRLGEVPVSEASVIIAVSSPHRKESLHAVEYAIDALKASVPIWKKEVYDNDEATWKENKECAWANKNKRSEDENEECQEITYCSDERESLDSVTIDPSLVQIRASPCELNRRIESFIARKRQQVNVVNVQEFCCQREQNDESENSCARIDAILIRRKDSKSHVKVHRVLNTWGPQTVDQSSLRKVTAPHTNNSYSCVLDDRISTTERILGINKPVSRDVYERIKNIEDKILYLEGVSPEYKDFWATEDIRHLKGTFKPVRKRTYSMAELDSKLHELEDKYVKKMK